MARTLEPVTPAAVEVVRRELRRTWWTSTVAMALPLVIGLLLAAVVAAEVVDGDWLALVFPGPLALLALWWGGRLVAGAIATSRRESRLPRAERDLAVYVRGLRGTHGLAAAQDPDGLGILRGIWTPSTGRVEAVTPRRTVRGRVTAEVAVVLPDRSHETALLTTEPAGIPEVGRRIPVLLDPHHHRAVVDLSRRTGRRRRPADHEAPPS